MARERTVVKGIVLRAVDTKESDKILTVLTPGGKTAVVAKGARSRKSRVTACTQLLAYAELTLTETHGWQYLGEGSHKFQFKGGFHQPGRLFQVPQGVEGVEQQGEDRPALHVLQGRRRLGAGGAG